MTVHSRMLPLAMFGICLGLAGCVQLQALQKQPSPGDTPTESNNPTEADQADQAGDQSQQKTVKAKSLHQIIRMLEAGKYDAAAVELKYYRIRNPKDHTARNLLKQLTTDPLAMLGPPAHKYTVQSGDTLGGLAGKYLGSPLDFVILARYNGIKRSKDLMAGQVINLPATKNADQIISSKGDDKSAPVGQGSAANDTTRTTARLPSNKLQALPSPEPRHTTSATSVAGMQKQLNRVPEKENLALKQQAIGMDALKNHQDIAAYQAFQKALHLDPSLRLAHAKAEQVGEKLVHRFHKQALTAYREQKLDRAIALWNKAIEIDPKFEPALGYRARALELKQRLNQLEQKK